jgi:hypothetical protein
MDGKGRYKDNIFVERLWRTVKYEEVYSKAYIDGRQATMGLDLLQLLQQPKAPSGVGLPNTSRSDQRGITTSTEQ